MHLMPAYSVDQILNDYTTEDANVPGWKAARWSTENSMRNRFHLAFEQIQWKPVHQWLDVGCGSGDILTDFQPVNGTLNYVGLDLTPSMIVRAQSRSIARLQVKFVNQDFASFSGDADFDLVTAIGVLQKCGLTPSQFFARANALLGPRGQLFITTKNHTWREFESGRLTPYDGHHWFNPAELLTIADSHNLHCREFGGFLPQEGNVVAVRDSHTVFFMFEKRERT